MRRLLSAITALLLCASLALAASTINPNVPAPRSALSSGPIQQNFAAAYNDVTSLESMFYGPTAPSSPLRGQDWLNTTNLSAATWSKWNDITQTWVVIGTFNLSAGTFAPVLNSITFNNATLTGTAIGPDGGTWSSTGFNGSVIGAATPEPGHFTSLSLIAALTYGGVTLTNAVTGTGAMVLSNNPIVAFATGTTAVTQSLGDITRFVATDAFVGNAIANLQSHIIGQVQAPNGSVTLAPTQGYSAIALNPAHTNVWGAEQFFAPSTWAPINIGQGSTPSPPINGDVWNTSSGTYVQNNGLTSQVVTAPLTGSGIQGGVGVTVASGGSGINAGNGFSVASGGSGINAGSGASVAGYTPQTWPCSGGVPVVGGAVGVTCGMTAQTGKLTATSTALNTSTYTDGPSVAQGSTGTFNVFGQVLVSSTGNDQIKCKLWDGTNEVGWGMLVTFNSSDYSISVHGVAVNPAGNLKISCIDNTSSGGFMIGDPSHPYSQITAIRID